MTPSFNFSDLAPEERTRLGAAGFRTFVAIADRWRLSVEERRALLDNMSRATYDAWSRQAPSTASAYSTSLLIRLSYLLGIAALLEQLYTSTPALADAWITAPNNGPAFGGKSPLEHMHRDGIPGMLLVRRVLESRML